MLWCTLKNMTGYSLTFTARLRSFKTAISYFLEKQDTQLNTSPFSVALEKLHCLQSICFNFVLLNNCLIPTFLRIKMQ